MICLKFVDVPPSLSGKQKAVEALWCVQGQLCEIRK